MILQVWGITHVTASAVLTYEFFLRKDKSVGDTFNCEAGTNLVLGFELIKKNKGFSSQTHIAYFSLGRGFVNRNFIRYAFPQTKDIDSYLNVL